MGREQKDWPQNVKITGFCYYDADSGNSALAPHLEAFLATGPPPVVFTLGSAAVMTAGRFFEFSAKAAMKLGVRAVLLIGADARNRPRQTMLDTICVAEYAPYSKLFSRAALVVHQGGVGTTAQCLRAGVPMLIMPYSHDQPDNARRVQRLKVARVIQRGNYTPVRVARKLKGMLAEPMFALRAKLVAQRMAHEDGVGSACDALEELYEMTRHSIFAQVAGQAPES
jgi:UDP:flavonoid glycosyltransferase YjiC (YdhE family)